MRNSNRLINYCIGDTIKQMNDRLMQYQDKCCCVDILGSKGKGSGMCFATNYMCDKCIEQWLGKEEKGSDNMYMWHYRMIPYLPDRFLREQFDNCIRIAGEISIMGNPKSLFLSSLMKYPIQQFRDYCNMLIVEMLHRSMSISEFQISKLDDCIGFDVESINIHREIFKDWHNDAYMTMCVTNLMTLKDQSIISQEEWETIIAAPLYGSEKSE